MQAFCSVASRQAAISWITGRSVAVQLIETIRQPIRVDGTDLVVDLRHLRSAVTARNPIDVSRTARTARIGVTAGTNDGDVSRDPDGGAKLVTRRPIAGNQLVANDIATPPASRRGEPKRAATVVNQPRTDDRQRNRNAEANWRRNVVGCQLCGLRKIPAPVAARFEKHIRRTIVRTLVIVTDCSCDYGIAGDELGNQMNCSC